MTLEIEVTHRYAEVRIDAASIEAILERVSWRTVPTFARPGRSAWYVLPRPAAYPGRPGVEYRAAKLKGVGAWNPPDDPRSEVQWSEHAASPRPPSTAEYTSTALLRHVGVSRDGEFAEVTSSPAPYGGILHERALLEFDNATSLLEHVVPSIAPLLVVRYPELNFRDRPMGAVVSLSPEEQPFRAHVDDVGAPGSTKREFIEEVYRALEVAGDPEIPIVQWRAVAAVARRAGALLRAFAEAGHYRYSMQLENFQFDRVRSELILTDLDSSQKLDELPAELQGLELLRDLSAGLHKLAWRLHYFGTLDPWSIERLQRTDPFVEFLRGYFAEFNSLDLTPVVAPLWRLMVPHLFQRRRLMAVMAGWERERIRSYEVDPPLFCSLAMVLTFPLLDATPSLARRCAGLDRSILAQKIQRFLGPQSSDYLAFLLR
ncbi:hypothetical protein [Microvirga calopogonii]|uniref:hypothetical protein n=1 Tax=Microvirga calopogonii TaxID=2078013 RepID=UPI000E0CE81E|nr:hypothetical protein [Microvirga calopogonii]